MKKPQRVFSPYTREATQLLGARISQGRRLRQWSTQELADRIGVTRVTLQKIELGDPTVGLGLAFEAAALVGVPLFHEDRSRLTLDLVRTRNELALLPQRIRSSDKPVYDSF